MVLWFKLDQLEVGWNDQEIFRGSLFDISGQGSGFKLEHLVLVVSLRDFSEILNRIPKLKEAGGNYSE